MTLIANETSQEYTFTAMASACWCVTCPHGFAVTLTVMKSARSRWVWTMRLEELIEDALGKLEAGQVSVELEF